MTYVRDSISHKEAAMLRILLATSVVLLMADHSNAQVRDLDPGQCEQLKQAVAQYGYAAARQHAWSTMVLKP